MEITTDDFFTPLILKSPPVSKDYQKVNLLIQAVDSFARSTHLCAYIIDYYKQGFLYVSNNPLFLCGETTRNVVKSGYQFYLNRVPKEDLAMLLEINSVGFAFFNKISILDRMSYSISYDFHLIQANKRTVLVNHNLTPLALDMQFNMWLALCVVTHSSNKTSGNVFIRSKDGSEIHDYSFNTRTWTKRTQSKLTIKEKEILALSMQGYTLEEIAKNLKITPVTVKFHRGNIFRKLNAKNIPEAVSFAKNTNIF